MELDSQVVKLLKVLAVIAFWVITTMLVTSVSGSHLTAYYRAHGIHSQPGEAFYLPSQSAFVLCVGFSILFPYYLFRKFQQKFFLIVWSALALIFSDGFFVLWFVGAQAETSTGERIVQPMALFFLVLSMICAGIATICYRRIITKYSNIQANEDFRPFWQRNWPLLLIAGGFIVAVIAFIVNQMYLARAYNF